jgi:prophage endopeptidase
MIALPWGLIARVVGILACVVWVWFGGYQYAQRGHAAKEAEALRAALALRDQHAARIAEIDRTHTAALEAARNENIALAAAVAAGTKRLRVAASCPVPAGGAASVGDAAGPELDAAARPTYYALRDGLARQAEQLAACQALLKTVSAPTE